jgi:predicted amidophosphoribosyltransferase
MRRERRTLEAMVGIYCRGLHDTEDALCEDCRALLDYARERLRRCPFQAKKPTCANCPVHCYRSEMRQRVRAVMRYAGPRMLWRHPLLAVLHLVDGLRTVDEKETA